MLTLKCYWCALILVGIPFVVNLTFTRRVCKYPREALLLNLWQTGFTVNNYNDSFLAFLLKPTPHQFTAVSHTLFNALLHRPLMLSSVLNILGFGLVCTWLAPFTTLVANIIFNLMALGTRSFYMSSYSHLTKWQFLGCLDSVTVWHSLPTSLQS